MSTTQAPAKPAKLTVPAVTSAATSAVEAWARSAQGQAAATSGDYGRGMAAVVRSAIAAGKVPGFSKGLAQSQDAVKALGRSVRATPRKAGMGVGRGRTYGTKNVPAPKVLARAHDAVGKAAKAGATKAKRKAPAKAAPAKEVTPAAS